MSEALALQAIKDGTMRALLEDNGYQEAYNLDNPDTFKQATLRYLASGGMIEIEEAYAKRIFTAWDLCGDWWWVGKYAARIVGGKSQYLEAVSTRTDNVRLSYLNPDVHQVNRYVRHDTRMELVKFPVK